jgi:hypothetical protein
MYLKFIKLHSRIQNQMLYWVDKKNAGGFPAIMYIIFLLQQLIILLLISVNNIPRHLKNSCILH